MATEKSHKISAGFFNRISVREKAFFAEQIGTMLQSGLHLTQAIEVMESQTKKPNFKEILKAVHNDLESGKMFSESLQNFPQVFDRVFVNMTKAGEASGRLDEVLIELSKQLNRQSGFASKIKSAMMYPVFVLVVMVGVAIFATVKIIPSLSSVFQESNVTLPASTKLVIGLSNFIIHFWYLVILIVFGLGGLIYFYLKTDAGRAKLDYLLTKEPSGLARKVYMARFCRTLGSLLKGGIPIIEAVNIVSETLNNIIIERSVKNIARELERGVPISQPIGRDPNFPPFLVQMVIVGEQTGRLDQVLLSLADYFETDADGSIKNLTALFEPVIIVIIAVGVGFLVFSIIMPIYSISQNAG